ncbi:MAG: RHS repeat-associated core domain-containing protein [Alphaproteobacteria bacterium]
MNQLTGSGVPTYDAAGEVTDDYKMYRQSWDAEHRMIKAEYKTSWGAGTYTSQKTEFQYDGLGRRTVETEYDNTGAFAYEWHFAWCQDEICQVRWSWGETVARRYFPEGQYALDTGKKHVHMPDMLGSVRDIVNVSTSAVDFSIDYGPGGEAIRTNGSVYPDHRLAGMFQAGPYFNYQTRHRILDPFYLTWQSRDPIGENGGTNLYAYVGGKPTMNVDPLGLSRTPPQAIWVPVLTPPMLVPGTGDFNAFHKWFNGICHSDSEDTKNPDKAKHEHCEALRQSILNTCVPLSGAKKAACLWVANTTYNQCMED